MERAVVAVRAVGGNEAEAELACHHCVRLAATAPGPGSRLDCPHCDRAEVPAGLEVVRTTALWDESTMPDAVRRDHRVAAGVWGRLVVESGELRFRAETNPPIDVVVRPGRPQGIPPEVVHHVEALGPVRFAVEFLRPARPGG